MQNFAVLLGAFGSMFNTYVGLYLPKDNDLLCGCKSFSTAYDELDLDTLGDKKTALWF